jgi:methylase of polypeptide subunit release factors
VLDLCTGTGCIPLLFQHEFASTRRDIPLKLLGVDISHKALDLARRNRERVFRTREYQGKAFLGFVRADVLVDPFGDQTKDLPCLIAALSLYKQPPFWDVLISNPPYISPTEYWTTTTRSVRGFEPKLALVPPPSEGLDDVQQGDRFYLRLLETVRDVEAKIALFEVGDIDQAFRVARMARKMGFFQGIEIWRDQPDATPDPNARNSDEPTKTTEVEFPIIGAGNGRSVFCYRGVGAAWLAKSLEPVPHAAVTT